MYYFLEYLIVESVYMLVHELVIVYVEICLSVCMNIRYDMTIA